MLSRLRILLYGLGALAIILGCRAADIVVDTRAGATLVAVDAPTTMPIGASGSARPATELPPEIQAATETQQAIDALPDETAVPTQVIFVTETPTRTRFPTPTRFIPPTPFPSPTRPLYTPTITLTPTITRTPTPLYTSTPTRTPYKYRMAVVKPCEPDSHNTVIEGTVYANGQPENGVYVRLGLKAGSSFILDAYVSGTDPIDRLPDPQHPGRYYFIIQAGAPLEGNWWVFVVDKPGDKGKQISEASFVHTNDTAVTGNCQHAYIDFMRP